MNASRLFLACLGSALVACSAARASTAYGTINNFDVVNDTGTPCHGFEVEIEDCPSTGITYTYDWNHYGTCKITQDDSIPGHPKCLVRWSAVRNPDGTWPAYTAVPTAPISPTDGHMFTNPAVNFGGEHFGVGINANAATVRYFWLVDDGAGALVRGPAVQVSTPSFTYYPPPAAGAPGQVQAAIKPPEAPEVHVKEFGPAVWVKEIRTTSHNDREVKLRDLVSDDPGDATDRNWRNDEPDEVETEWEILQTEFNAVEGGKKGKLDAAGEDLPHGDEVVTRRYEFFEYTGPLHAESGEVATDSVGPDDIHGSGTGTVNGVEVDFSAIEVVGKFLGSQMSAFDPDAEVGLAEHLQNGEVGEVYPDRLVVIPGATAFTCTRSGDLPDGLMFDEVTGILSGTPAVAGEFSFTIEAADAVLPAVAKTYTIVVVAAGEALPPQAVVDTMAQPVVGGITTGSGSYDIGEAVNLSAVANPGYHFVHWTDQDRVVGEQATYTFTADVHHAVVAHFAADVPAWAIQATATPSFGGSVSGMGSFENGSVVILVATASPGYRFVNWTEAGVQVATTSSYSFPAAVDRDLAANFVVNNGSTWALTLNASPTIGGTISGGGDYADESQVSVIAAPNPGYLFKRWERGNSKVSELATYRFTLQGNLSLTARFVRGYAIATSSSPSAAGGTSGGGTFEDGDKVVVVASPSAGYRFSNWTEDGTVVSTSPTYQFRANPARNLVANFDLVVPEPVMMNEGDGLGFHWPAGMPDWVLEECSDLSTGEWTECELEIEAADGECRVHIVPDSERKFFRLRHP